MLYKMDAQARQTVRILLVEADPVLREGLRDSLSREGFRSVVVLSSLERVKNGFEDVDADLLVIDAQAEGADACELIRKLRYSRGGRNPFASIILTVWQRDDLDVDKLINSGADHIVIKPIAPKALFDRIEALVERRRPFVATSTYIGPDRRKGQRDDPDDASIPVFAVPNTLKLKAEKRKVDPEMLQKVVDMTLQRMNTEMIDKLAFQIVFQQRRLKNVLTTKGDERPAFNDMKTALDEFRRRIDPEQHAALVELATRLDAKLGEVGNSREPATERDLELMEKLSIAIYMAFKGDGGAEALASKVNSALATFERKALAKKTSAAAPPHRA
jgi:DNA-binding response OmpR family regulator